MVLHSPKTFQFPPVYFLSVQAFSVGLTDIDKYEMPY